MTTRSMGTAPLFESHHMLYDMPLGNSTIMGGIAPCAIAVPKYADIHGMLSVPSPDPCSQISNGNVRPGCASYSGGSQMWKLTV